MTVSIIVAKSSNGVIGVDGDLPWKIPEDMRRFRELTMGHPVIMGRVTYQSLPDEFRPLPGRTNIVVTRDLDQSIDFRGCQIEPSFEEALLFAGDEEVFVIGGESIYKLALPVADRVYVTLVEDYVHGNRRFPTLGDGWKVVERGRLLHHNDWDFRFLVYERA